MSEQPTLALIGVGQHDQVAYAEMQLVYREQIVNKRREALPEKTAEHTITPEMAIEWLKRDTHNRPLRMSKVREWADEMKNDRWKYNGQSISFKKNGELNDGQHRLWACIVAKTPFRSLVAIAVDNDAFATVDTGLRRSAADVLALEGFANQQWLAAAARTCINYEASPRKRMTDRWPGSRKLNNSEILAYVEAHTEIAEIARIYGKSGLADYLSPGLGIFCWMQMRVMDKKKADQFMEAVATGAGLHLGAPALTLREELRREEKRLRAHEIVARVIRAWNAYFYGRRLERFFFRADGWAPNFGDKDELRDQEQPEQLGRRQRRVVVEERIV